jgi:Ca-activated chloride channel family protein
MGHADHKHAIQPMTDSTLDVSIHDLVATYTLHHSLRNTGREPLEAVYSFPVPLDAAFMGMTAELAGERITAQVVARTQAERTYDDAIAEGHSAAMLSAPEPGMLCVSLGNLLPGEAGEIELRFALQLRVADQTARFTVPLVHRPRYGRWRLDEIDTPTHDFLVEHPMSLQLQVTGMLAGSRARCLSHEAEFIREEHRQIARIDGAYLDRDVVVLFDLDQTLAPSASRIADGRRTIGVVSVPIPASNPGMPLDLVLLLDGSGSMQGDAIDQSRTATRAVAEALGDSDRIQVIRFGSNTRALFRRALKASPVVRRSLLQLVGTISADLGGTEMSSALIEAFGSLPDAEAGRQRAVIMVTDGAVQACDIERAQSEARKQGIRVFVVAVGGAAGVEVLEPFAESTLGVLERAVPLEPIDACVMRQFRRARTVPVAVSVRWPASRWESLPMPIAYPGDIASIVASWEQEAGDEIELTCPAWPELIRVRLGMRMEAPALRAIVGQRMCDVSPSSAVRAKTALRYGLLTRETSAVLVKVRADGERSDVLPTTIKVPQMLAEGMLAENVVFPVARSSGPSFFLRQCREDDDLFATEAPAQPIHQKGMEEQRPVRNIASHRVREILEALFEVLRRRYLADLPDRPNIEAAIAELPEELRRDAADIVAALSSRNAVPERLAAITTLRLAEVLSDLQLSDDEESCLAELKARVGRDNRSMRAVPVWKQLLDGGAIIDESCALSRDVFSSIGADQTLIDNLRWPVP